MKEDEVNKDRNNKGKMALIIIIILLIISAVVSINPIKEFIYKKQLKEQIENEVLSKCEYDINLYFLGKYNELIHIEMNDNFENLNYDEQKDIMTNIAKDVEKIYKDYKAKVSEIDTRILNNDEYKGTFIHIGDRIFQCSAYAIKIKGSAYTKEDFMKDRIFKKFSVNQDSELFSILKTIDEVELEEIFDRLQEFENENILLEDLRNKHQYDGKWRGGIYDDSVPGFTIKVTYIWIINGSVCYNVYDTNKMKNDYTKYYCNIEDETLYIFKDKNDITDKEKAFLKFQYNNEKLTYNFIPGYEHNNYLGREYTINLNKISDNVEKPSKEIIKEPKIGMTKAEAEVSTWGKPNKINKTTTAYGVSEQWVYSNNRYLYFDNGKLTSIQE